MSNDERLLDETEIKFFLSSLAFVREFSIDVVSLKAGSVTVELPFCREIFRTAERLSGVDGRNRRRCRRGRILPLPDAEGLGAGDD
jgi:hypothetical protein